MNRLLNLLAFAVLSLAAWSSAAAPPRLMSYQGVLADAAGVPINASVTMVFRLYDVATGGTALYMETQPSVTVSNGIFNARIGAITPIPLAFDVPYWLSVQVGADGEMAPRQPLSSSAYALRAASLDAGATVAGSQITGSISSATIPVAQVIGAVPGPQGPPGPTSVANCPSGMTRVDLPASTLCYNAGPTANWDQADNYCDASFRAPICTLPQWRAIVCRAGLTNPGNSWTTTPTGTATYATIGGCSSESVSSAHYTSMRVGPCCLEWMKY